MYASNRRCSPKSRASVPQSSQSCFSWQTLSRIARKYNEANPQDKIEIHRTQQDLYNAIRSKMPECKDEKCWTRARFLNAGDREELIENFKPPIPQGKYAWLNTDDIDRVLTGYEKVFSSFSYLGAHPLDFQTYTRGFKPVELIRNPQTGKKKFGIVLNLDRSNQPGSHWVAIFIDINDRVMEYYDSYGLSAPKEVREFFDRITERRNGWTYKENKKAHQQKNSECGVYSINFIVQRISGSSFDKTVNTIVRDAEMNERRQSYFDPLESYKND